MDMRTTNHGPAQPLRKHRLAIGNPLTLLARQSADAAGRQCCGLPGRRAPRRGQHGRLACTGHEPVAIGPRHPKPSPASKPRTPSSTPRTNPAESTGSLTGRIKPGIRYRGVATAYEAGDGNGACLFGTSDDSVGRIPITWRLLSPAESGTISIRYKGGSSQWWCGIQAIGHRNPVAALEVRTANGWRKLQRTDYNYFLAEDGNGCGRAIRITDIYGERLTIDGIALRPDVVQPTRVQFARH
jgi:hypothetical protein